MVHCDKELIFIHINRTGGTSIEAAFGEKREDHETLDQIRQRTGPSGVWDAFYKFSIVRNPWDRLVSVYCRRQIHNGLKTPFDQWIARSLPEWWVSQCSWIYEHGQPAVDFVGRFENLWQDFDHVCDQLGRHPDDPMPVLPHLNKTHHRHYSTYYPSKLRDMVAHRCAEDIKEFGYEFEEPA